MMYIKNISAYAYITLFKASLDDLERTEGNILKTFNLKLEKKNYT